MQYGLRSVHYFGAKCWNDIPIDIGIHHLLVAFVKSSKPSSLKTITNHRSPKLKAITLHQIMELT